MVKSALKLIVMLLACTGLAGLPGCATPDQTPQTVDDWMALDQITP